MSKFRKKVDTVEAIQVVSPRVDELPFRQDGAQYSIVPMDGCFKSRTKIYAVAYKTWLEFEQGDWIVKSKYGFYPLSNRVFQEKYEPVQEAQS